MAIANLADAKAQFLANMTYADSNSLSMARLFRAAVMALQVLLPMETHQDRGGTTFDKSALEARLNDVNMFIGLHPSAPGGGTGRYLATDEFRDGGLGGVGSQVPDTGGYP